MKTGLNTINAYIINSQAGETVPLSVTATSSTVQFANLASAKNFSAIIQNVGSKTAFISFGTGSSVTATVPASSGSPPVGNGSINNFPILAGAIYTMQKNSDASNANDTIAAICGGSDTTTLYITSVQGS